jgi:hypothetical protein
MLGRVEVFGRVFILRRIATAHIAAGKTEPQVNPGVSHFYAFFADMLIRRFNFDLVEMSAFLGHQSSLLKNSCFRSSDHGHVTKGHNHSQEPPLSLTMSLEGIICVAARLFVLRVNHRVHNFGGATVLGRLGIGGSE